MSYGSEVHLALLCAILPFLLGFQILFITVLSTVSTENFCSLGQNMGQKPRSRFSAETRLSYSQIWCCDSSLKQKKCQRKIQRLPTQFIPIGRIQHGNCSSSIRQHPTYIVLRRKCSGVVTANTPNIGVGAYCTYWFPSKSGRYSVT